MARIAGFLAVYFFLHCAVVAAEVHFATGIKIGDVTANSAKVWVRLTAKNERLQAGIPPKQTPKDPDPETLHGSCPGTAGRFRIVYGIELTDGKSSTTPWHEVSANSDFCRTVQLENLSAGAQYHLRVEAESLPAGASATMSGSFRTAPLATVETPVFFTAMTCQAYKSLDDPRGFLIYDSMRKLKPDFTACIGDLVYYDNDLPPVASTVPLARHHWQRIYSLPRLVEFLRGTGCLFLKDDHDILEDDAWPGKKARIVGPLSFEQGRNIFVEQNPVPEPAYKAYRWGKDLEVWCVEGRDFRTPNPEPDGPNKTIWGAEQKAWFKKTVAESNATFKILISPTPLVGPDRAKGKNDNHANAAFQHEGDELRDWISKNGNGRLFVICGDRHWQYHSKHPTTGVQEFACGAASDPHAGGTPGLNPAIHQFHRVKGGFLSVRVSRENGVPRILLQHHGVDGEVVYSFGSEAK